MLLVWLKFIICALIILWAGSRLTRYGDVIAEKTGLTRAWIGLVLLASITSLPELVTGVSSVTFIGEPDLAVGTLLGACLFNMVILTILDILHTPGAIWKDLSFSQVLTAGLAMILLGFAGMSMVISQNITAPSILGIGFYTILIFVIYLVGQRLIFRYEHRSGRPEEESRPLVYQEISAPQAYLKFFLYALVVIAAGIWLASIGNQIADLTRWGETLVGSLFLAIATTMPELVVSISALKIGAVGMAVGNLFGSNVFNISILFIADIFYRPGPLLAAVSVNHIFTAMLAVILMGITMVGLISRTEKKTLRFLSWESLIIIITYLVGIYILFRLGIHL